MPKVGAALWIVWKRKLFLGISSGQCCRPVQPDILSGGMREFGPLYRENPSLLCPAAVTAAVGRASIQIDMKLQNETKTGPRETARLNRLVFGVALLWLATSLLLLLMYRTSPAHAVQPNRASQEQKLAVVAPPAAQASFIY